MQNQANLNYAEVQPKLNNEVVNTTQENLTQTSQNSRNNISEQDNQRELDTITQNTHCFARVGHPDGDTKLSTLNAKQDNSHTDFTDYTDSRTHCASAGHPDDDSKH